MLQCYLDDSGTGGLPVVGMAGFVAPSIVWERFEPVLDSAMNNYGVPIFHAKEFHDTKPPFKNWRRVKKRSFAEEIFGIVRGQLLGMAVGLRKVGYEKSKLDTGGLDSMSAMGVCFSSIMLKIVSDPGIGPIAQKEEISFLLESGNKNNPEIERFFHLMAKKPAFGCLRSISFIPKNNCRAIQLADFLAFYSRRLLKTHDAFSARMALPGCAFVDIMRKNTEIWMRGSTGVEKEVAPFKISDFPNGESLIEKMKTLKPL
ncbi:MAG: DUF3800 domain-containing protein [Afipia sp.]|nr:DUF3800 domain-containing protein [Afipia sp.]